MKTTISKEGKLIIEPEGNLEEWALVQWYKEWGNVSTLCLILNNQEKEIDPPVAEFGSGVPGGGYQPASVAPELENKKPIPPGDE